jgi:glycosyltransferase involved in cell wall biosynthesis
MRIAIVNNLYPPYGRDSGAEVIAAKMATDLRSAGHDIFIITTTSKNKQTDAKNIYFINSSYSNLSHWSIGRKLIWHLGQLILPLHKQRFKKILNSQKVDLVVTHNLIGLGFYLPKLLKKLNIPHRHLLHDIQLLHPSGLMYFGQENIINSPLANFYQFFSRQALGGAQQIISPSQWLLDLHLQKGFFKKQKTIVRPNFQINKQTPKQINKPVHFIFSGQLEKHKGIDILIEAWEKADLSPEVARLSIAGGGSLLNSVKEKCQATSNLNYVGHLNHENMDKLLKQADVMILPSLVYENSPTSLWEAAKYGLHAIASDIGGILELKDYLNLKLIPPNNNEALKQAILDVVR